MSAIFPQGCTFHAIGKGGGGGDMQLDSLFCRCSLFLDPEHAVQCSDRPLNIPIFNIFIWCVETVFPKLNAYKRTFIYGIPPVKGWSSMYKEPFHFDRPLLLFSAWILLVISKMSIKKCLRKWTQFRILFYAGFSGVPYSKKFTSLEDFY